MNWLTRTADQRWRKISQSQISSFYTVDTSLPKISNRALGMGNHQQVYKMHVSLDGLNSKLLLSKALWLSQMSGQQQHSLPGEAGYCWVRYEQINHKLGLLLCFSLATLHSHTLPKDKPCFKSCQMYFACVLLPSLGAGREKTRQLRMKPVNFQRVVTLEAANGSRGIFAGTPERLTPQDMFQEPCGSLKWVCQA